MADEKEILIPVRIDSEAFRAFAVFDAFWRRSTLRRIGLFTGLLTLCACACFALGTAMSTTKIPGLVLGWALLAIGWLLPAVYLFRFFSDLRKKAQQMGLSQPRLVYTVRLSGQGVLFQPANRAQNAGQPPVLTPWAEVHAAWRTAQAVYLYVAPQKAYLLPNGQARGADDAGLWAFLADHLAAEKLHDRVKK